MGGVQDLFQIVTLHLGQGCQPGRLGQIPQDRDVIQARKG